MASAALHNELESQNACYFADEMLIECSGPCLLSTSRPLLAMAIRSAWWMRDPRSANTHAGATTNVGNHRKPWSPYQNWPKHSSEGLAFKELDKYLRENPGDRCRVHRLYYSDDLVKKRANFGLGKKAVSCMELQRLLLEEVW